MVRIPFAPKKKTPNRGEKETPAAVEKKPPPPIGPPARDFEDVILDLKRITKRRRLFAKGAPSDSLPGPPGAPKERARRAAGVEKSNPPPTQPALERKMPPVEDKSEAITPRPITPTFGCAKEKLRQGWIRGFGVCASRRLLAVCVVGRDGGRGLDTSIHV